MEAGRRDDHLHFATKGLVAAVAIVLTQHATMAEPQRSPSGGDSGNRQQSASEYGPDYNGKGITRPENNVETRLEDRRSGTTTRTDENILALRRDGVFMLDANWKVGWSAELPVVASTITATDPAELRHELGIGDAIFQGVLVRTINERWAYGFGARLVTPTAEDALGGGKWQIMPGFGVRYSFLELGAETYFVPKIRYAMSFGGDPSRRNINEPQIAPTFNIGLPNRWFVTLFPSYDIRINYGDPTAGQTGRLFLPFDAMIGRKVTDNVVVSLEVAVPIIRDYPVYNFRTELRMTVQF